MTAQLLLVNGTLETRDGVIHIIAGGLYDCTPALQALRLKSRDFH
jgi:error-prone DNA polymerase